MAKKKETKKVELKEVSRKRLMVQSSLLMKMAQ